MVLSDIQFIGLVRNFWRFFRRFPRTVEEVLEGFILRIYIGGTDCNDS